MVRRVAVLDPVLLADVLVLPSKVLGRLGEPDRRIAVLEKGKMVAPAEIAVGPVDHADLERRDILAGDVPDRTGELAGRRVVLAARPQHREQAVIRLRRRRHSLCEEADRPPVYPAAFGAAASDDVVVEHRLDVEAALPGRLRPVL